MLMHMSNPAFNIVLKNLCRQQEREKQKYIYIFLEVVLVTKMCPILSQPLL